jgi:hypothetical protein
MQETKSNALRMVGRKFLENCRTLGERTVPQFLEHSKSHHAHASVADEGLRRTMRLHDVVDGDDGRYQGGRRRRRGGSGGMWGEEREQVLSSTGIGFPGLGGVFFSMAKTHCYRATAYPRNGLPNDARGFPSILCPWAGFGGVGPQNQLKPGLQRRP